MSEFLNGNEWGWRLLRAVAQGVLGVIEANVDLLMGCAALDPTWRAVCAALVMAVLSLVMAAPGKVGAEGGGSHE